MSEPLYDLGLLDNPILIRLRDHWLGIAAGRRMPLRADFDPVAIPDILASIVLFDVVGDPPRFRFRVVGSTPAYTAGVDPTGRFFDEFPVAQVALDRMVGCVRNGRPYFVDDVFPWAEVDGMRYATLVLPLADKRDAVGWLIAATDIYSPETPDDGVL